MKYTIKWLGDKKKIQTKYGEKEKFSFMTLETGDKFISVWVNNTTDNWKEGQEVEFTIKEREYNGKTYYDADLPKPQNSGQIADLIRMVGAMDTRLGAIYSMLQNRLPDNKTSAGTKVPDFSEVDDIGF
jgi:hypothetical protein